MNPNNTTYMDPQTSLPVNNMISCLMHGILVNFCGYPQINNELVVVTLTSMKLTNMQHFDEYFMEYLHHLHTLSSDMILDLKWKEIFSASLPNWVTTAILNKLLGKIGAYKFCVIRQAIKAVIVELCSQMKVA